MTDTATRSTAPEAPPAEPVLDAPNGAKNGAASGATNGAASGPTNVPTNGAASGPTNVPTSLRRDLVLRLRLDGPSSPDQLADRLGASRTGVLQQLRALETANLVSRRTVRHGVGRPRHLYDVTLDAQDLFPSNYDALAAGLLDAIETVGGDDLLDQVLAARRRQLGNRVREHLTERVAPDAPLLDRVRELAVIQADNGYLADAKLDDDGAIRLREHNCAIYRIAQGSPAVCRAELELFAEVLGADVVREQHIASGDRCCTYRITAHPD